MSQPNNKINEEQIKYLAWNTLLQREKISVMSMFFKNSFMVSNRKPVTKSAVNAALNFLDSIPTLHPMWFASHIETSGAIMFLSSDEKNTKTVIITGKGSVIEDQKEVDKYIKNYL